MKEYIDDVNRIHKTNGPARIWANGMEEWRCHGLWHRYYGPAFISTGSLLSAWYIHHKKIK
jgi:hypothetical protein